MPRARKPKPKITKLGSITSTDTSGQPFFFYLASNGTTATNAGAVDYSAAATDFYKDFTRDAVLVSLSFVATDSSIARFNGHNDEGLTGAVITTNGLKFKVNENGASNYILDISDQRQFNRADRTIGNCTRFAQRNGWNQGTLMDQFYTNNSTTSRNVEQRHYFIWLQKKFGNNILINSGARLICTINDNFTGIQEIKIGVGGYYA